MKTRLLIFSFIALSSSVVYADTDTATDTQTLRLTVPLVALIDVEDISPSFTFTAPTNAGQGFSGALTAINNTPKVAISSNNSSAQLKISTSNNNLSAAGISLQVITTNGLCGFAQSSALTTTPEYLCKVGMLKTTDGNLVIIANPLNGVDSMIPHGNSTTDIIYTLTEN